MASVPFEAPAGTSEPVARPGREAAESAVRTLIRWAGDDPDRQGPDRRLHGIREAGRKLGDSRRQAAVALGHVTEAQFDQWVNPEEMALRVTRKATGARQPHRPP